MKTENIHKTSWLRLREFAVSFHIVHSLTLLGFSSRARGGSSLV
jgi:hypothetical protein